MSNDLNRLPYCIVFYFRPQNLNNLCSKEGIRAVVEKNVEQLVECPIDTYKEEAPTSWNECKATDDQVHDG